jgi:hypothetical protein
MRKIYACLVITILLGFSAKAQYVAIPDTNFRNWLVQNYPACMSGGMMDTTCNDIVIEQSVNVDSKQIHDLDGIQYFDSLVTLSCSNNDIDIISALPPLVENLYCGYNPLTVVSPLPVNLIDFDCSFTYITLPDPLPASLVILNCNNSHINSLPNLPFGLGQLYCSGNYLYHLPDMWNVGIVECSGNNLVDLPYFGNNLHTLYCDGNDLQSLSNLPASLTRLYCGSNNLNALPNLPINLNTLNCVLNPLTALPPLPWGLDELYCGSTQISNLPTLPGTLRTLECGFTPISNLPPLPMSLRKLVCGLTQISSLPELPQYLEELDCSHNPNISCLPLLPYTLTDLRFNNTAITCLPNYVNLINSNPALDTIPLCDIFNANSCQPSWNISGRVYTDTGTTCTFYQGEPGLRYIKLTLNSPTQQVLSSNAGLYSFNTDMGVYTIVVDTSDFPFYVSCPDTGFYTSTITLQDSFDTNVDFGLRCKPGFDVGATSVVNPSGIIRPANYAQIAIKAGDISNFYNAHCAAGISGAVQVIINGPASYVSSNALPVSTVNGDTLTWNIADFGIVDFNSDFNITIHTDTLAQIGQQVCFEVTVTPTAGDNNISNNTLTHCFDVVNSYDPNDKTAYPGGDIDTAQEWINYTIRFQNTGNAPAQHIYVMDTLDSDIDVSTFKLLAYSHDNITQVLPGGIIKFNFPNINLPDSFSNEPLSHGYVQYKVKLKDNLPIGTTISNTAFIYFDFNAPVVTNTAVNTITDNVGIGTIKQVDLQMALIPNPAHNTVTIQLQNISPNTTLKVFDVLGTLVKQQTIQQVNTTIDISTLQAGLYFVQVESVNGRGVKRLVVQ